MLMVDTSGDEHMILYKVMHVGHLISHSYNHNEIQGINHLLPQRTGTWGIGTGERPRQGKGKARHVQA